jgi:hypothetical protein
MDDKRTTVAQLTIYYKNRPLTNMIFDTPETADKMVEILKSLFTKQGAKDISFKGELKNVYTTELLAQEANDAADGKVKPTGTILDMMKLFGGLK